MMSNGDLPAFSPTSNGLHTRHMSSAFRAKLQLFDSSHGSTGRTGPAQSADEQNHLLSGGDCDSSVKDSFNSHTQSPLAADNRQQEFDKCRPLEELQNCSRDMHANRYEVVNELPCCNLGAAQPLIGLTQKTIDENAINSKDTIVKKSRPNSLAILSRSHDLIHTIGEEEVGNSSNALAAASSSCHRAAFQAKGRYASADNLLQPTKVGLQQRRNQRPTSLLIPNILDIPKTSNQDFSFTSHSPAVRQRSHSVPSAAVMEVNLPSVRQPLCSLEEALSLLNKKKIGRSEIDGWSLLHRAADSGHVKLAKKCIQAGCSVVKTLNSLNGTSALHCAARADKNSAQVTRLLLETGMVDVNTKNDLGETAIFSAIIHKNMETVDVLVEYGCDINSVWQESTPLYLIISNKDVAAASKAIENGARITSLSDKIRQPLHAVLDLCHMQAITYRAMKLLRLMVQADGSVLEHLDSYSCNKPGQTNQDIIYHIYRMERGPLQNEGKQIVRDLVKLGYMPSRGELAKIGQSDDDYDYLYSYIKSGPAPLKDLCVRTIRKACGVNVIDAMNRCTPAVREAEKLQILLKPPADPDNEYENVQVIRRHKGSFRSKHKSLKGIMSGFGRLSRKFSKKNPDADMQLQLSLPSREMETAAPPPVANKPKKPAIKPKPTKSKYIKRESQKKASVNEVADIVNRYSDFSLERKTRPQTYEEASRMAAIDNPAYVENEAIENGHENVGSSKEIDQPAQTVQNGINKEDITSTGSSPNTEESSTSTEKQAQTPMTGHPLLKNSQLTVPLYKGSIHIADDETM